MPIEDFPEYLAYALHLASFTPQGKIDPRPGYIGIIECNVDEMLGSDLTSKMVKFRGRHQGRQVGGLGKLYVCLRGEDILYH